MKAEGILCPGSIRAEGLWNMPGPWANPNQRKLGPALSGQGSSGDPQRLVLACSAHLFHMEFSVGLCNGACPV